MWHSLTGFPDIFMNIQEYCVTKLHCLMDHGLSLHASFFVDRSIHNYTFWLKQGKKTWSETFKKWRVCAISLKLKQTIIIELAILIFFSLYFFVSIEQYVATLKYSLPNALSTHRQSLAYNKTNETELIWMMKYLKLTQHTSVSFSNVCILKMPKYTDELQNNNE